MKNRLDVLKQILEQRPNDTLARYGLAMEHLKSGDPEDAVAEFRKLIAAQPDYAYAYYHAGQALERLGKLDEARATYRDGIAHATDAHAKSELEAALELLG